MSIQSVTHVFLIFGLCCAIAYIPAMRAKKIRLVLSDYLIWAGATIMLLSDLLPAYKDILILIFTALFIASAISIWRTPRQER